jgi:hypothetical protein
MTQPDDGGATAVPSFSAVLAEWQAGDEFERMARNILGDADEYEIFESDEERGGADEEMGGVTFTSHTAFLPRGGVKQVGEEEEEEEEEFEEEFDDDDDDDNEDGGLQGGIEREGLEAFGLDAEEEDEEEDEEEEEEDSDEG